MRGCSSQRREIGASEEATPWRQDSGRALVPSGVSRPSRCPLAGTFAKVFHHGLSTGAWVGTAYTPLTDLETIWGLKGLVTGRQPGPALVLGHLLLPPISLVSLPRD